jgi:hypothetical protein
MAEKNLPFPRGRTYGDNVVTLDDDSASHLEGQIFEVEDTVHGTGRKVLLRCVKNDTGAAITIDTSRRLLQRFSENALDFGRRVAGNTDQAGDICKPMDDAYPNGTSIPDNDLFYLVDGGPCYCTTEAAAVSLLAHDSVAADSSGRINGAVAAAGEFIIGQIDAATQLTDTQVVVHVNAGLANTEA